MQNKDDLRVLALSALASGLILGGALSLPFLYPLLLSALPTATAEKIGAVIPTQLLTRAWPVIALLGAGAWGEALARIGGYRHSWRLGVAGALSVPLAVVALTFSDPLFAVIGWLLPNAPPSFQFSLEVVLDIGLAGAFTGLAFGLALWDRHTALALIRAGGLASLAAAALTVAVLSLLGVRIGSGNAAMLKVASISFVTSASAAGVLMGWILARHTGLLQSRQDSPPSSPRFAKSAKDF